MADPAISAPPSGSGRAAGDPARDRPNLLGMARTFLARVVADPVRHGRLRDIAWPYGLRAVVGVACLGYAIGAGLVVFSSAIRRNADLTVPTTLSASIPRPYAWVLIFLVLIALGLFQTAALHAPWWLRGVSVVTSLIVMGTWGVRYTQLSGGLLETAGTVLLGVGLVVLVILRARRAFRWWEFPVVLALLGAPVALGIALMNRTSRPLGYDFVPVYLEGTVTSLAPVALPAAVAAGLSVAEITVSATLWATRLTARWAAARVIYAVLAALLGLRVAQAAWQLGRWDFVEQGWNVFATWALLGVLLAGLSVAVLRVGPGSPVSVAALPERMAAMALPLGIAVVGMALIAVVILGAFSIAAALAPARAGSVSSAWLAPLVSTTGPNLIRCVVSVGLLVLAFRAARRGRQATGLLLTAVAVMLWAQVARWATDGALDAGEGAQALNLLAAGVILGVAGWFWARRSLTPQRAAGLAAALVLSTLLSYRDFISDPLGALLGFSGAALVLFGLTWGLLTDNAYANTGSRKYPAPTRVMLVLANVVLAITILAYLSLVRDPTATVNLEDFAALGDYLLGTALLAATFVAVLAAVRDARTVE